MGDTHSTVNSQCFAYIVYTWMVLVSLMAFGSCIACAIMSPGYLFTAIFTSVVIVKDSYALIATSREALAKDEASGDDDSSSIEIPVPGIGKVTLSSDGKVDAALE